jgi:hypothetical protein
VKKILKAIWKFLKWFLPKKKLKVEPAKAPEVPPEKVEPKA